MLSQLTPTVTKGFARANANTAAPAGNPTNTESPCGGAQLGVTRKFAGNRRLALSGPAILSVPAFTLKNFDPLEKYGIRVTLATPMSTPPWALVSAIESSTWRYCVLNTRVSVIRVESPAFVELVAAPSTSLFPSHTVTKVGSTFIIICVWVKPPRKNVVNPLALVPGPKFVRPSSTSAPGTATLLMYGGGTACTDRSAQLFGTTGSTRVCA